MRKHEQTQSGGKAYDYGVEKPLLPVRIDY